ncbi:putative methyltransferase NSUN7 [Myxocyprinus asiaticus]|uniref:putative methyltransferase NSUN7 n=1 Tax=Myxocyprinus asiaticus TaxID=70543 RepID=UPI00222359E6|nr:putative methyltransferase NSUN7 [Myxocyprinus asiaticus]
MVKQNLGSTLDSNLPDIISLNLLDQETDPKNKAHSSSSFKGPTRKLCTQSLKKGATTVPTERIRVEREKTPLGFPDAVYSHAAAIFQNTHVEKDLAHRLIRYGPSYVDDDSGNVVGGHARTKQNEHWAHELSFNTLKYQDLLEEILIDSCFYPSHQMPDDLMALVVVILYDLLDRKFQTRESIKTTGEGLMNKVRQVEDSLYRFRTKLEASLAHFRIKQNFLTIDSFLPQLVRVKQHRTQTVPLYAWVNTLNASVENVCEILKTAGFAQVDSNTHLAGQVFCKDTHCSNVLLFPRRVQKRLEKTKLLTEHTLIIQDKSRSLVAGAVRPLLVENCDVLMVGSFSALTVAHVAVQTAACSGCVHVCGVLNAPNFKEELQTTLSSIGCKNVKLLSNDFTELNEWDLRIQKVRVILVLPQCSASALCNPVEFILNESGDKELLHGLSKGTISDGKLEALVAKQTQDLNHALTFPKVKAVVYCTCSVYLEENERLVKRTLENADNKPKALPFRLVSAGWGDGEERFFKIEASDFTNGCFLCVMKREQDPAEVETVQDVLARAAAKGLLGGLLPPDPLNEEKQKDKKRKKQKGVPPALPPSSLTEHSASLMTSMSPPDDSVLKYATINLNNSSTILQLSSAVKSQRLSVMDGKSIITNHSNDPNQASNIKNLSSTIQKKQSNGHRPRGKVAGQSRTKKASKSRSHKERQRSRPPRKRLPHLRPSQHATVYFIRPTPPQTKPVALKAPVTPYEYRHLQSRGRSQQEVINPKQEDVKSETCRSERKGIQSRDFTLPPIHQLSPSHHSSSLHRLYSSSSNFFTSISSSSSIAKGRNSTVSISRSWR